MSNLIRNRWLRRTLFLAGLIAIGVGIYHFEPPEPMCVIEADGLVPEVFRRRRRTFRDPAGAEPGCAGRAIANLG